MARNRAKIEKNNRKKKGPVITKTRFLKALPGTGGIKKDIAERLGVGWGALHEALKRKGWDDMRKAYQEECETLVDIAEQTIRYTIEQRLDIGQARQASQWYLERKAPERGYKNESKLKVEGGDHPIQIEPVFSIDSLNLSIDLRRQILEAIEKKEIEQLELKENNESDSS